MHFNYKMGNTVVGSAIKENNLGVMIVADVNFSEQCGITA